MLNDYFQYTVVPTAKPICGKILPAGSLGFMCIQCMVEENSILCVECFNKSDHAGHNYQKIKVQGCCDCGNEEMWKKQGFCTDHCLKEEKDIEVDQAET